MLRSLLRFLPAPIFLLALASCGHPPQVVRRTDDIVILISIDGFRWDYLSLHRPPTLTQLAAEGSHAERLLSCFPTKTFPNHYSIATGLRPEHHGLINNDFFDPALNDWFGMHDKKDNTDPRWWGGEPIWITAEKQHLRTGCFFWPGIDVPHDGLLPTYSRSYDAKLSPNDRVDGLLAWLDLPPAQRPRLLTLYFEQVDTAGHDFGPESPQTTAAVFQIDQAIARLRAGLAARGLAGKTDLVIVSDHGMQPVDSNQVVFIEDLVNPDEVQIEFSGVLLGLRPHYGSASELAETIRRKHPRHLKVYQRGELPDRLHYRDNLRIPPVIVLPEPGWEIVRRQGWEQRASRFEKGAHGYEPSLRTMGALFIASGPAFRPRHEFDDVENIHLYNLLCALLGLTPAPNDGDNRLVREVLAR